jgi:NAD(P)-dependent dehydrogenase (short-subunit alcohol dehydrogenase family)
MIQNINNFLNIPYLAFIFDIISQPCVYLVSIIIWAITFPLYMTKVMTSFTKISKTDDKLIVITGCDTGFGRDIYTRLNETGFHVFVCCLNDRSIEDVNRINKGGLVPYLLDVTKGDDLRCLKIDVEKYCLEKNLRLHAIINNAGIAIAGPFEWVPMESFRKVMEVNFFGTVELIKVFLPLIRMYKTRIINISSASAKVPGLPLLSSYSCSKHAVTAFTDSIRLELARWGVKVSNIVPAFHKTDLLNKEDEIVQLMRKQTLMSQKLYDITQYLEKSELVKAFAWDRKNVTNVVVHCLLQKNPLPEYYIGLDVQFLFPIYDKLPYFVKLLLLKYIY